MTTSENVYRDVREVLLQLSETESDHELRSLFAAPALQPWKDGLPQADSQQSRVDALLAYLEDQRSVGGERALFILLRELAERTLLEDPVHVQLLSLTQALAAHRLSDSLQVSGFLFEGQVTIADPQLDPSALEDVVQGWIAKQDKYWPTELTASALSEGLSLSYVAYWIVSAEAEGTWRVPIETGHEVIESCPQCDGTGKLEEQPCPTCEGSGRSSRWIPESTVQSGIVTTGFADAVVANVATDLPLPPKEKYEPKGQSLTPEVASTIQLMPLAGEGVNLGRSVAEEIVLQRLEQEAERMAAEYGDPQEVQIVDQRITQVAASTWLYPFYTGNYTFGGKRHVLVIDGITGQVSVEIPESVRQERWFAAQQLATVIFVGFLIFTVLLFLIFSTFR